MNTCPPLLVNGIIFDYNEFLKDEVCQIYYIWNNHFRDNYLLCTGNIWAGMLVLSPKTDYCETGRWLGKKYPGECGST
ncbi:MAG: hypothetical protein A2Y62_00995 [Candidatus Fischerbacteria bacterium RBG_13_37_8]|uniref:Uncharacterized protein n=1 Tax=Candidatus Fischerbacteria bacterium RBG_13_37_8 TaxID=1817863 RepID=A0A1F5VVF6_9BACT|nr:MAG: hypothetical protein A2Y62_00995 [Candidatus Fischerbacteria bacterium RBG_13_37_8]